MGGVGDEAEVTRSSRTNVVASRVVSAGIEMRISYIKDCVGDEPLWLWVTSLRRPRKSTFSSNYLWTKYRAKPQLAAKRGTFPVTRRNIKGRSFWSRVWVLAATHQALSPPTAFSQ
jgi:hypothetical protein